MDDKFERFKNGPNKLIEGNLTRVMNDIAVTSLSEDSGLQMLEGCTATRGRYRTYFPCSHIFTHLGII